MQTPCLISVDRYKFAVMMVGGGPRKDPSNPNARKGKQGHTMKKPVAVAIERAATKHPSEAERGPKATARPIADQTAATVKQALAAMVDASAHPMSDRSSSIAIAARGQIAHDTVNHSAMEFARGGVHTNGAESFNNRFRRTVIGVFHHVSSAHVTRYLDEAAWRWRQRLHVGKAVRQTRNGRSVERDLWERVPPARQIVTLLRGALGRELRRRDDRGIDVLLIQPVFG